jgi:hypothetical protein
VWARPFAADHAACVTAKGCSERSGLEPLTTRMNATRVCSKRIVPEKHDFGYSGAVVQNEAGSARSLPELPGLVFKMRSIVLRF